MKLLANKVHIQGMIILLDDKVHKQERQRKWLHNICTVFLKRALNKTILKEIYQMWDGWIEALADKVQKQEPIYSVNNL